MSIATGTIGLIPSADSIGVTATLLLVLCRCVQGFTAGGEYSGAATYMFESVPDNKRMTHGSRLSAASFGSFAAAALVIWAITAALPEESMLSWGWRIPFLLTIPLGIIGFWVRLHAEESRTDTSSVPKAPIPHALRTEWRTMLRVGGLISCTAMSYYMFTTYFTTFMEVTVGMSAKLVLAANVIALALAALSAPFVGMLIDRFPRRSVTATATLSTAALAVPGYFVAQTGDTLHTTVLAQILLGIGAVSCNCMTSVLMTELFDSRTRATSAGITYNTAYAAFGGTAPFVATALIGASDNPLAPAFYTVAIGLFAFGCSRLLPESSPLFATGPTPLSTIIGRGE